MSRLAEFYKKEVVPKLTGQSHYSNKMAVPTIEKIVVNSGVGRALENPKNLEDAVVDLGKITGQKPLITKSKKAISGFKLRQGSEIGVKVTLRADRMWDFLDRLINLALPRARDFRGVDAKFDGTGNLSIGIAEHIIFPEIKPQEIDKPFGLEVTMVTSAKDDKEGKKLLQALGMIFEK